MSASGRNDVTSKPTVGVVQTRAMMIAASDAHGELSFLPANLALLLRPPRGALPRPLRRCRSPRSRRSSDLLHDAHLADVVDDERDHHDEEHDRQRGTEALVVLPEALPVELVRDHRGTSVVANEFYWQSFRQNDKGFGAALAVVLFVVVIPLVVYNVRQMRIVEEIR